MRNEIVTNGLKAQYNLAQGNALGLENRDYNRPTRSFHRRGNLISDERDDHPFPSDKIVWLCPKDGFLSDFLVYADGITCISFTQGVAVRLSAHVEALG